jgi:hypothetical protein
VTESAQPQKDFRLEASMPEDSVPLETILCTEELRRRPWRPSDYEKENRALVALAKALVDSKSDILQILAETILEVTQCDSSGLSLLTKDDGGKRFYWPAIAGVWKPHTGGGTPRNCGPCGDVLDHNCALLFRHFERRYTAFLPVMPAAAVGLAHERGLIHKEHILEVLKLTDWLIGGQDGAASRLGLPRTTLIYKMRKLGIEPRRWHRGRSVQQTYERPLFASAAPGALRAGRFETVAN